MIKIFNFLKEYSLETIKEFFSFSIEFGIEVKNIEKLINLYSISKAFFEKEFLNSETFIIIKKINQLLLIL